MLTPEESENLTVEYGRAQESAVIEIADQGLLSLSNLVASGSIDVSPKFQRRDRWSPEKQSLLIESFLTNIPVPPVYLAEDVAELGSYAVIDGKQRLTAVSMFFAEGLQLRGLTRLPGLNGCRYGDLPRGIRNSLGMKNLRVTTLLRQSTEELKHEVFLRLNTGGEILNAQEIRNVAGRGPLNDLVYDLAENGFLRGQFKVKPPSSPAYRKMADAEFVLRFLALSSSWREFKGELRAELDTYMIDNRFANEGELKKLRNLFNACIETCEATWGIEAFKRPGRDQALAGVYDAQMLAMSEIGARGRDRILDNPERMKIEFERLFEDSEFDEAARRATNTPSRLRFRTQQTIDAVRRVSGGAS